MSHRQRCHRLNAFTDSPHPGCTAYQAEGNVCPHLQTDLRQLLGRKAGTIQPVKANEYGSCICTAAAHACLMRNPLFNLDLTSFMQTGMLKKEPGSTHRGIGVILRDAAHLKAVTHHRHAHLFGLFFQPDSVSQSHTLHDHIHQMVAILPPSHNVQRQVDLGGSPELDLFHVILLCYRRSRRFCFT